MAAEQKSQTERSRALALKFVEVGTTRIITNLAEIFDESAMWTMVLDKELAGFGIGGSRPAATVFAEAMSKMKDFDEYSFVADSIVADGNRVFLDVVVNGSGPGPVTYYQNYAFYMTTEGDKVTDLKVWSDPFQVKAWMERMHKYATEQAAAQ